MIDALLTEHDQDGTHGVVTGTSFTASGTVQGATVISTGDIQHRSVSLETIRSEMEFDYVASGCVWSGDAYASTRNASMTSGVIYINGRRLTASAVSARSFTASKDTYIDASDNGDGTVLLTYNEVANNAASPALAANKVRVGIIVTGATNIAAAGSVNQGQEDKLLPITSSTPYAVTDSLGNLLCPRDPSRKILGYRQTSTNTGTFTGETDLTGLSLTVNVADGRKIKITSSTHYYSSVSGDTAATRIKEGSTVLRETRTWINSSTGNHNQCEVTLTPTAGVHTYKLAGVRVLGAGNIMMEVNGANEVAFIKVELV